MIMCCHQWEVVAQVDEYATGYVCSRCLRIKQLLNGEWRENGGIEGESASCETVDDEAGV
jgi:hypothetical protein